MRIFTVWCGILFVPLASCAGAPPLSLQSLHTVPADWIKVEGDGYSLMAPPGTTFEEGPPFDSIVGHFQTPEFKVYSDLGIYAPNFRRALEHPETGAHVVIVDGKDTILMDELGNAEDDGCALTQMNANYLKLNEVYGLTSPDLETTLWLYACAENPAAINTVRQMFLSVKFSGEID